MHIPLCISKALHLKSIDYAQGLLFEYFYLAATSIKRHDKADPRGWPLNRGSTVRYFKLIDSKHYLVFNNKTN
jgi:hypothetical protein